MSRSRIPAGVPSGGQFVSSTHTESAIALARLEQSDKQSEQQPDKWPEQLGCLRRSGQPPPPAATAYTAQALRDEQLALAICERLVARRHVNGTMTVPDRIDDVEVELRDRFPHIEVRELGHRLSRIGKLAEQISVAEAADATDTHAYAEAADEARLDLDEFPIDPADDDGYSGIGGASTDCEAFRAAVIEELDHRLQHETSQLAASDARQANLQANQQSDQRPDQRAGQRVTRLPAA